MDKLWKVVKIIVVSIIVIIFLLIFSYQQSHYIRIGHVVLVQQWSVYYKYEFTDSTGNAFEFWSTEEINPYDTVKVTMNNNKTDDNIKDDTIENYKIIFNSEKEK